MLDEPNPTVVDDVTDEMLTDTGDEYYYDVVNEIDAANRQQSQHRGLFPLIFFFLKKKKFLKFLFLFCVSLYVSFLILSIEEGKPPPL